MKVLQAASEVFPYSKTGGLADMVSGLSKSLAASGVSTDVVTPLYRGIREKVEGLEDWGTLEIPMGGGTGPASILRCGPADNLSVYFVDAPGYYDRKGIYNEDGSDYADNAERYVYFSKCATELARRLSVDIVHAHDWQTGLVPALIGHQAAEGKWDRAPKVCFSIHNLVYQGIFPYEEFQKTGLPHDYFHFERLEYFGQMNCLKGGIALADWISTVSPTYAREITTAAFGATLENVLRARRDRLGGILNGVDYEEWKTIGNPHLSFDYKLGNLRGKGLQKKSLQKEFGLPQDARIPLFGSVTRLDPNQKGIDILLEALKSGAGESFQFVLLGSGDKEFETAFSELAAENPERFGARIGYDHSLAHRIEAGCDFFLMPSRYEPCGLNQMYSLRYGTIPVVRGVGGLEDSVVEFHEDPELANGLKFTDYSSEALAKCIRRAQIIYENPRLLKRLRSAGMRADHSWNRTAKAYRDLYDRIRRS